MSIDLPEAIRSLMYERDGFCHPDWFEIGRWIEAETPETKWDAYWTVAALEWIRRLQDQLGGDYVIHRTENFLILTEAGEWLRKDMGRFCERALREIARALPGVASDEGFGPHVVLMFGELDDYYRYGSYFHPDGELPMSGGEMLDSRGYGHLIIPTSDVSDSGGTLVHELTHACVSHLQLPSWINEALAMRMENAVCQSFPLQLDRNEYQRHVDQWDAETIQHFWSGRAWSIPGDTFELAYPLAQVIWNKVEFDLGAPRDVVLDFVLKSDYRDAGQEACQTLLGLTLGEFVADFLGDGDWEPKPEKWNFFR